MLRSFHLLLLLGATATAQIHPDEVLLVVNDASEHSRAIGDYYASIRAIPPENVMHLVPWTPTDDEIDRATYNAMFRDPISEYLIDRGLRERIRFIILTKGVPVRLFQAGGDILNTRTCSVDSELTQLFTGLVPDYGHRGRIANPYFAVDLPFRDFDHPNISYLVFRLDAFDGPVDAQHGVPIDVKRLIDRAQQPAREGLFVFDADSQPTAGVERQMKAGAQLMRDLGFDVLEDFQDAMVTNVPGMLGYFGWGSNDGQAPPPPYWGEVPPGSGSVYPGSFVPGAIGHTYVSSNGRTFTRGNESYGQSLIAGLIELGLTAGSGHVYEPIADSVTHCEFVLRAIARGHTVGEAFYQGLPHLSWMTLIACDPLMTFDFRPELDSVSSSRARVGETVTLSGWGFTNAGDTEVRFGSAIGRSVVIVNGQTTTARIPPDAIRPGDGPGGPTIGPRLAEGGRPLDITVTNSRGRVTLEKAITVLPAKR